MAKRKEPNPVGRPTKYNSKLCNKLIEFFDISPYKTVEGKLIPNDIPFLTNFAKSIGVTTETIYTWRDEHKEFSDALKEAKEFRKQILVTNSLRGLYNTTFAIFAAKNYTDMKDKNVIEHEGNANMGITLHAPTERKNGSNADSITI